jgi:hypothetical protein
VDYIEMRRIDSIRGLVKAAGRILNKAVVLLLLVLAPYTSLFSQGDKKRSKDKTEKQKESKAKDYKEEMTKATASYKSSLKELLNLYEGNLKRATEKTNKLKELYAEGIVSKREIEESERSIIEAKAKLDETNRRMEAADQLLAETLIEMEVPEAKLPIPSGKMLKNVAYIRYAGTGRWSISDISKIENFFFTRFGKRLPISAFGQSELHTRWGFNHRNAVDVAIHPDSAEGEALIAYLYKAGIPFFAFRRAVSGSATGPHIHIGKPSHRITG